MKKFTLIFIAIVITSSVVYSNTVNQETAKTIALNFFKVTANTGSTTLTAALKYTRTENDNTVDYYIFDISPVQGFVIVSADDNALPVIGYSTETNFNTNVSPQNGLSYWMGNSAKKIHRTIQQHVQADTKIKGLWSAYLQGQNPNVSRSSGVSPLLSTTWDQYPYYNALCPYNSTDHQLCVTGCVATAMAQIMKYWGYPAHGTGSYSYVDGPPNFLGNYGTLSADFGATTYNWANMPNSISSANNDIATLMYQCGVSVAMDYGDNNQGGSGAWVLQSETGYGQPCAQYSYTHYFSYNPNTIQGVVKANYSSTDWMNMMENELNANRVIQYEGYDGSAGGHTWVCDGYDVNNMLHMNWGWSGYDNGFYAVSNLDASPYNFSDAEAALIGIEPLSPISVTALAANPVICPGTHTTLTAQGPVYATYSWTPTTGLSCSTCAVTMASPTTNTVYTVTVDSAGILGSASTIVAISQPAHADFSVNAVSTCSVPVNISFNNTSANATNYLWDFGDGTTGTDASPVHAYNSYGTYTVKLLATNLCTADSTNGSQVVQINDETPVAPGQDICAGQTATLVAISNGSLNWYDAPTGGNLLGTGNTYTTPALNSNTTYYVSAAMPATVNSAGPADSTIGGGGYFQYSNGHQVIFNCTVPQTLISVDVYSQYNYTRTIQLQDSTGYVIHSASVNIPAGHHTITLNMPIPAENNLMLSLSGTVYLYRNSSGANYPYTSTDGSIVLTNSDAGVDYYYYFYNWKLQQAPCNTNRASVDVSVFNTGQNSFTATASGNTINFSPSITGPISYSWDFGDGATSTQVSPSHVYAASGNYNVQLVLSNGYCSDTVIQQVLVNGATGIADLNPVQKITLYPNPAKDLLTVNINAGKQLTDCNINIRNILGESIIERNTTVSNGLNTINIDVSRLASGVYLMVFQNGKETVTRRFVKTN